MTGFKSGVIAALWFVSLTQLCGAEDKKSCPAPQAAEDSKFHPGQVWEYRTRTGEEKSFLTVLKVESLPKIGTIVHVRVDRIRLKNCAGGPEPDTIQHMPFTREALDRSVTKLKEESAKVPEFQSGYETWLADCGGVYTVTVAQAVQADEDTFNSKRSCRLGWFVLAHAFVLLVGNTRSLGFARDDRVGLWGRDFLGAGSRFALDDRAFF